MRVEEQLFWDIFRAKDEEELDKVIASNPDIFRQENWKPLGQNDSNYSIVKNQQSNPIAALIEKITNGIDAILTKRCLESGIAPNSPEAPQTMDEALNKFFPSNKNWDIGMNRRKQAEDLQVIADGKGPRERNNLPTSVIIYDNGEGQHPKDFESTFLSLIRGNKNSIRFVQGKYNMGGSGAIVFCGKKRYQLIASKRYDGTGDFGFTLVREHPKTLADNTKETWFEYLIPSGNILSFSITELDLGLEKRKFKTGTIIKLYSYQIPSGISGFAQELNQSLNEFLFSPALPILTKDTPERYPNNKVLVTDLMGLHRRLQDPDDEYVDQQASFSEKFEDDLFERMKVHCYIFKTKSKEYDFKKTKETIQERYFKNRMSVLFSMNGQVHGHFTSEFITRSLKMNLLKNHLLIHVDCTEMSYNFQKELFMASRDRLKDGEETTQLRHYLAKKLGASNGRLAEVEKLRKQGADIDTSVNTQQLLKDVTKGLPLNEDLMKLLGKTFNLDLPKEKDEKKGEKKGSSKTEKEQVSFKPNRFPSIFKVRNSEDGKTPVIAVPIGGDKTITFETDVENNYFDRLDEPGEMTIAVTSIKTNDVDGGTAPGNNREATELFNIAQRSPQDGKIRISLNPKDGMLNVGDSVQMNVSLTAPGNDLERLIEVKIVEQEKKPEKTPKEENEPDLQGLPSLRFAYETTEGKEDAVSWDAVQEATGLNMDNSSVMAAEAEGDVLKTIYVNMESGVLMNFKKQFKNPNENQLELANRKYYTAVYFHTLFLYTITKKKGYEINQRKDGQETGETVDIATYLKDVFDNYYSAFILSFGGMNEMMMGAGE
jgi:hypothetical protein